MTETTTMQKNDLSKLQTDYLLLLFEILCYLLSRTLMGPNQAHYDQTQTTFSDPISLHSAFPLSIRTPQHTKPLPSSLGLNELVALLGTSHICFVFLCNCLIAGRYTAFFFSFLMYPFIYVYQVLPTRLETLSMQCHVLLCLPTAHDCA